MQKPFGLKLICGWLVVSMLVSAALIAVIVTAETGGLPQYLNCPGQPSANSFDGLIALGVYLMVSAAVFLLALSGLIGLLNRKAWGKILTLTVAGFQLLVFPLGTLGGFMVIRYLCRGENPTSSDQYQY